MALEFVPVRVPGGSGVPADAPPERKSKPIDDTVMVATTRVPNPARPRPVVESPHGHGDPALRTWTKWAVETLTVQRNQLYQRIPGAVTMPDGSVGIEWWAGWPISVGGPNALESMSDRVKTMPAFPGKRGASFHTGALTLLPLPRSASPAATLPGTYWAGIWADGWCAHIMPDGEMRTICGEQSRTDRWPGAHGSDRIWVGDFDTQWDLTNDLCLHPTDPGSFLVVDAKNHRIARSRHVAPGPNVEVRTWAPAGPFPHSIDTLPDGTVCVGDRDAGTLTLINAADPTSRRVLATIPGGVASVRRSHLGTLTVMEQRGQQRLLEVAADGSLRTIWTAPPGAVDPLYYRQHDTDSVGTIGPAGDSLISFWSSTGNKLYRVSFDGTYRSLFGENGASSAGSRQRQGNVSYVGDPLGHYPGWVRISREFAEYAVSSGAAAGVFLFRRARAGEPNGWTAEQGAWADSGASLLQSGGAPEYPSLWHVNGWEGFHYLGPSPRDREQPVLTERLVDLGDDGLTLWLQAGGRGETARPRITQAQARALRQRWRFADDRALTEGVTLPSGAPPPDVIGPDVTISGVPAETAEDFTVTVTASDPSGVASVRISLDGDASPALTVPPYTRKIAVGPLAAGEHVVAATAADTIGNSRTVTSSFLKPLPSAEDPEVVLTLPATTRYRVEGGIPV